MIANCTNTREHKELFFKSKLNVFWDTSILELNILIVKINIFWGDLSDVSAKKIHW